MIPAGRLRHRVLFEERVTELDSDGAQVDTWVPAYPSLVSAEIVALSGRELLAADQVNSRVSVRMRVRYRPGLRAAMRATHRETVYNIEAVIPDPDSGRRWITLLCSTGLQGV